MQSDIEENWQHFRFRFHRAACSEDWPKGHLLSRDWFERVLVDFTFWFFFRGKGVLIDHTNGISHSLHPGVCLCMRPGLDIEASQSGSEPLKDFYFHLSVFRGDTLLSPKEWPEVPLYSETDNIILYEQVLKRVISLLTEQSLPGYNGDGSEILSAEFLFKGLLLDIARKKEPLAEGNHHQGQMITTALSALYENPKRFSSVEDLAEVSGYSSSHFRALCLKLTGEKPKDLLVKARIDQAKKLLLYTDLTIGMIAEEVGYESIYYFSKQFKEVTGITASAYKKQGAPPR